MDLEYEKKNAILLEHPNEFEKFKKHDHTRTDKKYTIPMILFQIINYIIDLSDVIITKKRLGYPNMYSENFEILQKNNIINEELTAGLTTLCHYRNIIAHEYHILTPEDIEEITRLLDCINDFITITEKTLG